MQFHIIHRGNRIPDGGNADIYLRTDNWNDFGFVTSFEVSLYDDAGVFHELGGVKIGFVGQTNEVTTFSVLESSFPSLNEAFFSVGADVEYYRGLAKLSESFRDEYLRAMADIASDTRIFDRVSGEKVLSTSLMRSVTLKAIKEQYPRILRGGAPTTDYDFGFFRPDHPNYAEIDMRFRVSANSTPSTNIHALIGRNGIGKTTLLNQMITSVTGPPPHDFAFYLHGLFGRTAVPSLYFSNLISVAFSAFDPFTPPSDQSDPEKGPCYYYVGLKDNQDRSGKALKTLEILHDECVGSIAECFSDINKKRRWLAAIETLESDENFALADLKTLADYSGEEVKTKAPEVVMGLSSGHAIVLLTISKLVAKAEEKSLVLIDEPESHLHPPLLSAFTRALSQLLHDRNGVAIVATHSPVVLQEVPQSCAWVITRYGMSISKTRPRIECFGENVGVLTREVFGLEVSKSGYHAILDAEVRAGLGYDEILAKYAQQLGQEARGLLKAMVADRDRSGRFQ